MSAEAFGTRDRESMEDYARNARSTSELRAVLAEAKRERDSELIPILIAELERREGG